MKHAIHTLSIVLLAVWTAACAGVAVWYYPQVMQETRALIAAWQEIRPAGEGVMPDGFAGPETVSRYGLWLWLFAVALAWNLVATPLGIIALIAKPD